MNIKQTISKGKVHRDNLFTQILIVQSNLLKIEYLNWLTNLNFNTNSNTIAEISVGSILHFDFKQLRKPIELSKANINQITTLILLKYPLHHNSATV